MVIYKNADALSQHLNRLKQEKKTIGFVPTMGALHAGHTSLIDASKQECEVTVCSIFVNPTQFNDPGDFEKYPVTLEQDIRMLSDKQTDFLFLPSVQEIYPGGVQQLPHYQLGELEHLLEGKYRPNHFQGVCQVVDRLLQIVAPDKLYLGCKDYQQCMVIQQLAHLKNLPVDISIQPTLREKDGLAMSSRNMRLSLNGRAKAVALFRALSTVKKDIFINPIPQVLRRANERLLQEGFEKVDYITVADTATLQPIHTLEAPKNAIVLGAAFLEGIRLIDNMPVADA